MEKIKNVFNHFLISMIITTLVYLLYCNYNVKSSNFIALLFLLLIWFYLFFINTLLSFIFYYVNKNISKLISIILILIFTFFAIYLCNKQNYFKGLSLDKYPTSFLREHIDDVIGFLFLMINQLMVKFYIIVWQKIKRKPDSADMST